MEAAKIWPIILRLAAIGSISSLAPIRNIIMNAHKIYCRSPKNLNGVQRIIENIVPANMAIPPREGVLMLCARLSPGSSTSSFFLATLMIEGIAKKVSKNDVINARTISYIH